MHNFRQIQKILTHYFLNISDLCPLFFRDSNYTCIMLFEVFPQLIAALLHWKKNFFSLFYIFCRCYFCGFKFTNIFFAVSNLPLISSSIFFISDIVIFCSMSLTRAFFFSLYLLYPPCVLLAF